MKKTIAALVTVASVAGSLITTPADAQRGGPYYPYFMARAITAITAALGLPPVPTTTDPAVGNASASGTAPAGGFAASRFATKQGSTGRREGLAARSASDDGMPGQR